MFNDKLIFSLSFIFLPTTNKDTLLNIEKIGLKDITNFIENERIGSNSPIDFEIFTANFSLFLNLPTWNDEIEQLIIKLLEDYAKKKGYILLMNNIKTKPAYVFMFFDKDDQHSKTVVQLNQSLNSERIISEAEQLLSDDGFYPKP